VPISFYKIGLLIWPNKRPDLLRGLAAVYERAGKLEKAESFFTDAVATEPQNPISHWELGVVYEKRGKRDRAAEAYEKALSLGTDLSDEFRDELRNRVSRLKSQN
jgi:Tfp pilus assembly protein PilF